MEDEVRVILRDVLADPAAPAHPAELAHQLFGAAQGVELPERPGFTPRPPPRWD